MWHAQKRQPITLLLRGRHGLIRKKRHSESGVDLDNHENDDRVIQERPWHDQSYHEAVVDEINIDYDERAEDQQEDYGHYDDGHNNDGTDFYQDIPTKPTVAQNAVPEILRLVHVKEKLHQVKIG